MTLHLGHLALRVPDPGRTAAHATSVLGLRQTAEVADELFLSANDKHHELQLLRGERACLDHLGLEVDTEEELEQAREGVLAAGATMLSGSFDEEGLAQAFRVRAPGDLVLEIYRGMTREPFSLAHGLRGPLRKLGHITAFTPEHRRLVDFLVAGLGFRISDDLGPITWLRCDADHHSVAVGMGEANWLHHYALEIAGWDVLKGFLDHLALHGGRVVYGPLRHTIGLNIATYFPDPDGCLVEVYTELQQIENDETYVPFDWADWMSEHGARNVWGPDSSPDFVTHGVPIAPLG